jgi:lipid II:glycine glycyltransferase (peptidoglycan interpeptide bridge formation enzyme)
MPELNVAEWDAFLSRFPNAHILQSTAWGELKSAYGWEVHRLVAGNSGAQILFRRLSYGIKFAYIPKGPVGEDWDSLWIEVDRLCRQEGAVFLKIEPDAWDVSSEGSKPMLMPAGFRPTGHAIQPMRTLIVDLSVDESGVLGRMKQKTRYNVRLAQKKGIVVKPSSDLETFYHLMEVTSKRDRFGVHQPDYYQRTYSLFHPLGQCELLIAEYEGEPVAALMVLARDRRAWYFYGASSETHRELMPTYLIQWEAMRWALSAGCGEYDLWGVPDYDLETLEANFSTRSDGLWGVYRFKRGFGGELHRAEGPWDRIYNPLVYSFYSLWTKRIAVER